MTRLARLSDSSDRSALSDKVRGNPGDSLAKILI